MIRVNKIDHVVLFVTDVDITKRYYKTLFGFEFNIHPDNHAMIMVENADVHFFITENKTHNDDFIRRQHLSFEVNDLEAIKDVLQKNDITQYNEGTFTHFRYNNYKWLEWRDPDDIRIECIERIQ